MKTIHGMPEDEYRKLDAAHKKLADLIDKLPESASKVRGHGINRDRKGRWYIMVATIDQTYSEIPSEIDGYRVEQEIRPPAYLA